MLNTGAAEPSDAAVSSRRQTIRIMDDLKEEGGPSSEAKGKMPKTPRRSTGEDESGFSDYNPFQSGGEEAQDRERRRRKVSIRLMVKDFSDHSVVNGKRPSKGQGAETV